MVGKKESDKTVTGGTGITAGENVTFGDVSSPLAIGENVIQIINQNGTKSWLYTQGFRPSTDPDNIFGRQEELEEIDEFLKQNSALAITGFRGTGKSTLASMYTDRVQKRGEFAGIYWRKVDETIDISDVVGSFFTVIGKPIQDPERYKVEDLIYSLFMELNAAPYFLALDNFETLLDPITNKSIKAGFSDFIEKATDSMGKSRILFTSWECPVSERGIRPKYHTIGGLDASAAVQLLRSKGLKEPDDELKKAIELCGGHPLALLLLIQLVEGEEETFSSILKDNTLWIGEGGEVAENILDKVYNERLNEDERKLLQYLSLYRLPVPLQAIVIAANDPNWTAAKVKKMAISLKRKSLLQKNEEYYWEEALIDNYAYNKLTDKIEVHKRAYEYYLSLPLPETRTKKEDIQTLIEAHHHACMAKEYDKAADIIFNYELYEDLDRWGSYMALIELYSNVLPNDHFRDKTLLNNISNHVAVLGNLGLAYSALGQVDKAIEYYEQALVISREIGDRQAEGADLGNLGLAYSALGQVEIAIEYYEQALVISREIGNRKGEGTVLGNLGNAYSALGQVDKAIEYCEQALVISREIEDRRNEGNWLGSLGNAHKSLGQVDKAIEYYENALVILRENGDKRSEGADLGNLGTAYHSLGQVDKAIKYYEQALVISREIGDRRNEGNWLGSLGNAYHSLGQVDKAIKYYEQALVIAREIGDMKGEGVDLGNLGLAYNALGQVDKAIEYYEQALVIAREIGDMKGEGVDLGNLGLAYHSLGQVDKAIEYYEQALVITREIGDRRGEGTWLNNLGFVFINENKYKEALACYLLAKGIRIEIKDPDIKMTESNLIVLKDKLGEKEFEKLLAEVAPEAEEIIIKILEESLK